MIEYVIIGILLLCLVMQQGFYMIQMNKLINKIMSRNYAEYQTVQNPPMSQPMMQNGFTVELPDDLEDLRRLG